MDPREKLRNFFKDEHPDKKLFRGSNFSDDYGMWLEDELVKGLEEPTTKGEEVDKPIYIERGAIYIFASKTPSNHNEIAKMEIVEVTGSSYLVNNMDTGEMFRRGIVDFNANYKPIEVIETMEERRQRLMDQMEENMKISLLKQQHFNGFKQEES